MKTKEISNNYKNVQKMIVGSIKSLDKSSVVDKTIWKHKSGGGGITCAISGKKYVEKAAVNFSSIMGNNLPVSALNKNGLKGLDNFKATGVSVIIHPNNPKTSCAHMNIRFFEANVGKKRIWWFGGGFDLTPYFINKSDVTYWKDSAKKLCDSYDSNWYKKYSEDCDNYFYLPHRSEPRGVGGIFFDQISTPDFDTCKKFTLDCAKTFINSYEYLFNHRKEKKFSAKEKAYQLYRRGRYVEFNLLYDRGTLFGLQSGGRSDSILMSLPPTVSWNSKYDFKSYDKTLNDILLLARK